MYANVCIAGEKEKGDGGVERTEVCVCVRVCLRLHARDRESAVLTA